MSDNTRLIKIGIQGVQAGAMRIPASFFRHLQPGKPFVVLGGGERQLMHIREADLPRIRKAYREYRASNPARDRT